MVADTILERAGFLKDNLKTFIDYLMKPIQVAADAIFGPSTDNSHETLVIPPEFYATFYNEIRSRCFTDAYNAYSKGQGMQPCLWAGTIKLENGDLSFPNYQWISKDTSGWWNDLTSEEIDACANLMKEYDLNLHSYSDYPTEPTILNYNGSVKFSFKPQNHTNSDMGYEFTDFDGSQQRTFTVNFMSGDFIDNGDYVDFSMGFADLRGGALSVLYKRPFMMVTDNQTACTDYVSANGATNNYTESVTTGDGDPFTIYYGDNYIIYYIPNGNKLSYDDIQINTQNVINVIVNDNPGMEPVHVPTYDENKFGPEPPGPITDDDYIDMGLGVETDGMAMYNMAVLTRDDLIQLIGDFETNADTGLSFLPHVLGLYKLGIESSHLLTTKTDTINLHKEPEKTAFISTDNYNIVDEQLQVIDCGSITVDREELLTNTFLDFSPYSTYEMFIPGCGWITLPDTVVGRTISVHIVFDLTTCSCKGVVRSEGELLGGSGSTLATVNGIIGSSVPLSINETGLQRGAIMSGAVQTVTALGTTAMGIGIGNPYMGMSGIAMAAGSLAETHIAGNATYTSTKGGATDYSVFGDGYTAVLKITRPVLDIPDNYGHTVGYIVNKYDTLGNYSGFTVCLNPHVTGLTCTSDEKEEIARLLERGVILPTGE